MTWLPQASFEILRLRARWLAHIRAFFAEREVLEVETPILSRSGNPDPSINSFTTHYQGPGEPAGNTLYLHTSPEFYMKRLLAAGSGSIYQLARVFRHGEYGVRHNPEFTLLEWYRVGFDHHQLMEEVEALITSLLTAWTTDWPTSPPPLGPSERFSYRDLFTCYLGIDPHTASVPTLMKCAKRHALQPPTSLPTDDPTPWCDLLLTHCIEPHLGIGRLTFVYDYPVAQASLARLRLGDPPVAERFEVYWQGVELANGFHELQDAAVQRQRFIEANQKRIQAGQAAVVVDEALLAALAHGLPDCAGVALGVDRLLMIATQQHTLAEVMAFPWERCS